MARLRFVVATHQKLWTAEDGEAVLGLVPPRRLEVGHPLPVEVPGASGQTWAGVKKVKAVPNEIRAPQTMRTTLRQPSSGKSKKKGISVTPTGRQHCAE